MVKELNFIKMHGLGNDFILINSTREKIEGIKLHSLAIEICDRHFGVGADGLLILWPSEKADFRMQIINSDGSEAEMCGNGIRCFALYVYENSEEKKEVISVETKAGIVIPAIIVEDNTIQGIEVDMGVPRLKRSQIPMLGDEKEKVLNEEIKINNQTFKFTAVSMGNPHCIIFADNLDAINLEDIGPKIETNALFPESTNVEFVKVLNRNEIEVKVWERGAGVTLACGTGACAAVVAANLNNKTDKNVLVHLPGGDLAIAWEEDNHITMRGPAEKVFEGKYTL